MFSLILIALIGLAIALFSQQNTQSVSITIGNYAFAPIPVYVLSIVSMLVGLIVAWMLSMLDFFSTALTLRRKDQLISRDQEIISEYERTVHELKEENVLLRNKYGEYEHRQHEGHTPKQKTYFEELKERFALHHRQEALS